MASAASITAPLIWTVLAARRRGEVTPLYLSRRPGHSDHVGTRGRPVACPSAAEPVTSNPPCAAKEEAHLAARAYAVKPPTGRRTTPDSGCGTHWPLGRSASDRHRLASSHRRRRALSSLLALRCER